MEAGGSCKGGTATKGGGRPQSAVPRSEPEPVWEKKENLEEREMGELLSWWRMHGLGIMLSVWCHLSQLPVLILRSVLKFRNK